jgi:Ca-activated chloride channel family protein
VSALGLVLLALAPAQAATPTFPARVDAVYVDVFVTEGRRPVAGLSAADFELRDNGVVQPIELVAADAMPLATFLVLDASGSVTGDKLVQLHSALRAFVGKLRPDDEAALLTFDLEVRVLMPRTRDRGALAGAIDSIGPGGSTALFDALYAGTQLATGRERALVVLFTDGEDNSSWLDAGQLRRVLEESNVLLQTVGVVPFDRRAGVPDTPHGRLLRQLAEVTGGRFWPAASPGGLASAFVAILEAMKTRYLLRFELAADAAPGRHDVEVRLVRHGGRVHSRKAYYLAPAPTTAAR